MRGPFVSISVLLCLGICLYGCNHFRSKRVPDGPACACVGRPTVGQVAPEIEGVDLNGDRFKLSDYRGKVVVLDFWGNW